MLCHSDRYREAGEIGIGDRRRVLAAAPVEVERISVRQTLVREIEMHIGGGVVRVRQVLQAAHRDDDAGTVCLHISYRIIDRIGIGVRRIHIIRTVDQTDKGVKHAIFAIQYIRPVLKLVELVFDLLVVLHFSWDTVARSVLQQVGIRGAMFVERLPAI